MQMSDIAQLLASHGIRPTANRVIVAQAIADARRPVCLMELEGDIGSVDKSNIFRALSLFKERSLVHVIEDEAGLLRYEMCHSAPCGGRCDDNNDAEEDEDLHVHFYCRKCHQMTCLTDFPIPAVALPDGYEAVSATFIVKGVCPACGKKG